MLPPTRIHTMHHITYLQCQDEVLLNPIPRFFEFIVEPHDQHGVQGIHNRDGHAKEVIVPSPRDGLERVLTPRILFVASPGMLEHVLPMQNGTVSTCHPDTSGVTSHVLE